MPMPAGDRNPQPNRLRVLVLGDGRNDRGSCRPVPCTPEIAESQLGAVHVLVRRIVVELLRGPMPAFVAPMPRARGFRAGWPGVCHDLLGHITHPRDRTGEKLLQPYVAANGHGLDLVVVVCDSGRDDPAQICRALHRAIGESRLYAASPSG